MSRADYTKAVQQARGQGLTRAEARAYAHRRAVPAAVKAAVSIAVHRPKVDTVPDVSMVRA